MRRLFVIPLLVLAACSRESGGPTGLASCTYAVRLGDADYGMYTSEGATRVGPEVARTLRQRGCDDIIIRGNPLPEAWRNGDSSFPANTPVYASLDEPTSEVVLVRWDGKYLQLRKLPHPPSQTAAGQ